MIQLIRLNSNKIQMFKKKCTNPLNQSFADHFSNLKKTAEYRHMKHIALCYSKIVSSICKYPLPIMSSSQAMLLEGVGANMGKIFAELLDQRKIELGEEEFDNKAAVISKLLKEDQENNKVIEKKRKYNKLGEERNTKKRKEANIFEEGSENYLFLVCCYLFTLVCTAPSLVISHEDVNNVYQKLKAQFPEQIKRDSIKRKGNQLEQGKFIESLQDGTLVVTTEGINKAKELILKNNFVVDLVPSPSTDEGITYTFQIRKNEANEDNKKLWVARPFLQKEINRVEDRMMNYLNTNLKEAVEVVERKSEINAGEILLLIDTREVKTKKDRSYLYEQLLKNKISCEKRALPLGDALWIYRCSTRAKKPKEYVLNHIIERKKADDLASSIVDGRYIEQKHRLQECGIENVIYIVEGEPTSQCRVSESALRTAVTHTKVVSGFKVFRAKSIEETVMWLSVWTEKIKRTVSSTDISSKYMTYKDFCTGSCKGGNMSIQKVLSKQLSVVLIIFFKPRIDKWLQW